MLILVVGVRILVIGGSFFLSVRVMVVLFSMIVVVA